VASGRAPVERKRTEVQLAENFLFQQLKPLKGKKKARELVSQQYRLAKHPKPTSNLDAASTPALIKEELTH